MILQYTTPTSTSSAKAFHLSPSLDLPQLDADTDFDTEIARIEYVLELDESTEMVHLSKRPFNADGVLIESKEHLWFLGRIDGRNPARFIPKEVPEDHPVWDELEELQIQWEACVR